MVDGDKLMNQIELIQFIHSASHHLVSFSFIEFIQWMKQMNESFICGLWAAAHDSFNERMKMN